MTDVRASDAEREATISRLRDAAAEGRLTFEELADRIEAASAAVMRSDLVPLTADLPVSVARIDDTPEHVRTVGEIKRTGTWAVPAETAFRTWFGDVKLDLRRARISSTEIRIHAWSLFGDIDLLVPEGVLVDVRASATLGGVKQEPTDHVPGAPVIVLTGGTVFGDIKVRHKRLWEKLASRLLS
jgi:hypothetical protein